MIKTINIQSGETAGLYQYLSSAVTPRPIAFVSTIDSEGNENLRSHWPPSITNDNKKHR